MGSTKKQTIGYKYYLGIQFGLHLLESDRLMEILVDEKQAWAGLEDGTSNVQIDADNLFGGEKREGGVSGTGYFETGSLTQTVNSYLQSILGSILPAYRGFTQFILRQGYIGLNPYLKKWAFRSQRIYKTTDGAEQWYSEKAAISSGRFISIENGTLIYDTAIEANTLVGPFNENGAYLPIFVANTDVILTFTLNSDGFYDAWSKFPQDTDNGGLTWTNSFSIWTAETGQSNYWTPLFASAQEAKGYAEAQAPVVRTGSTEYRLHLNDFIVLLNRGGLSLKVEIQGDFEILDMNPAHIIREVVTDPDFGMGYQADDVDDVSFTNAADTLYDENFGLSLFWRRQTTCEEFIDEVLRHIDGVRYVDKSTGKFVLKLIRDDYNLTSLLVLEEDDIDKVENYVSKAFGENCNSVTVKYVDAITGKDASPPPVQDLGDIQQQGQIINTTLNYPGVSNGSLAARLEARDLNSLSSVLRGFTVYTNRKAASLNMGDALIVNWPDLQLNYVIVRVEKIEFGDGKSNRIRLTVIEDVFSLDDEPIVGSSDTLWVSPVGTPVDADPRLLIEAPYYELVQRNGETDINNILAADPDAGFFLVSAGNTIGSQGMLNASVYVDDGTGYVDTVVMDFAPFGSLVNAVTKSEIENLVLELETYKDIDQLVVGTHLQIGNELMRVDSVVENSNGNYDIAVGRPVLDTLPGNHAAGADVIFWDDYAASDETQYTASETVNVKLQTVTGGGVLPLASATEQSLTFNSRANRPYPPGNLTINTEYYPEFIDGLEFLTLGWAHRDRLQQTSGNYYDFTEGNIGPETNVYYELTLYDQNDDFLRTVITTDTTYEYALEQDDVGADTEIEDPYWANVVLLLNFNGTDGSTTFTDSSDSAHTFTAVGDAQIDTDVKKFGTGALLLDGATDRITAPDSADWDLGTGDFTVELWRRFTFVNSNQTMIGNYQNSTTGWEFQRRNDPNRLVFGRGDSVLISYSWTPTIGVWYHLAASRESGTLRLFIDGTLVASASDSTDLSGSSSVLSVGHLPTVNVQYSFGYFDDLRLTKGIARYTSSFVPPAVELAQFTDTGGAGLQGRLRFTLKAIRPGADSTEDDFESFYFYDEEVFRAGWDYNWGLFWGGVP